MESMAPPQTPKAGKGKDGHDDPWVEMAAEAASPEAKQETAAESAQPGQGERPDRAAELEIALRKKEEEMASLIASHEELVSLLKHVQADFENYKKRTEKEHSAHAEHASARLVSRLLPLLDSFERAEGHPEDVKGMVEGFRLIHTQLLDFLRQEGLVAIEAAGVRFDPAVHEVMMKEHSPLPKNTILEELQKGYLFRERVVRPSRVKVSSGPAPEERGEEREETKEEEAHAP